MRKRSSLLRALPMVLAFSSGIALGEAPATPAPLAVSPSSLDIKINQNLDAIAFKRIYRNLKITKTKEQKVQAKYISDVRENLIAVNAIANTCNNADASCEVTLEIFGPAGDFSGQVVFEGFDTVVPVSGRLENKEFSRPEKNIPEPSEDQSLIPYSPVVNLIACEDLDALDENMTQQCKVMYNIFMSKHLKDSNAKEVCENESDSIDRARCHGMIAGAKLSNCGDLTGIASTTCKTFRKAAVKQCDLNDFDCESVQRMMHGYLNCADHAHGDLITACVAYQNAYMDGISIEWTKKNFLPLANSVKNVGDITRTEPAIAFMGHKRVEALNVSDDDLKYLVSKFPNLTRSVLLNHSQSIAPHMKRRDLWATLESHLSPTQTVGFELECTGVQLDVTSGQNKAEVAEFMQYPSDYDFEDLLSDEERRTQKLKIDAAFEQEFEGYLDQLVEYDVWNKSDKFPYFNTYGKSLFQSEKKYLKFPLVDATLESRYSYDHFPHIEMVTAPLTQKSQPLNHGNVMDYLSKVVTQTCDLSQPRGVKFTSVDDWKAGAEAIPVGDKGEFIPFKKTAINTLDSVPLICQTNKIGACHVQSNVGVFFDQFFTDATLVQSIGSQSPYDTRAVYDAAWNIAKRTFSVLQWDSSGEALVDSRNHAAGIFTYFVYELYLRSILYAGKFDYWKGTMSHLMKYNLRDVWKTLNDDEKMLFRKAVLSLWSDEGLPEELAALTEDVLHSFIRNSLSGDPSLPTGERPYYDDQFASKVDGIFKELIWTLGLARNQAYEDVQWERWGSIVAEGTDLKFFQADGTVQTRRAFTHGCSYGTHFGSQCDIAKVIEPVHTTVIHDGFLYPRSYVVVETRYGGADFNKAVFWRCHDKNRSTLLDYDCK